VVAWHNKAENAQADSGERLSCYVTGERAAHLLLFCPDLRPTRNVVVPRNSVERTGRFENIFTRLGPAAKP
jgi:hypothetical protein